VDGPVELDTTLFYLAPWLMSSVLLARIAFPPQLSEYKFIDQSIWVLYFLISLTNIPQMLIEGYSNNWFVLGAVYILVGLFYLYKWNDWMLSGIKSHDYTKEGLYAVFYKPRNIIEFYRSFLGLGVSGVIFYYVDEKGGMCWWYMGKKKKRLECGIGGGLEKILRKSLVLKVSDKYKHFNMICKDLAFYGLKYHPITSNCLTAFKTPLLAIGVKVSTVFPCIFAKDLWKNSTNG